MLKPCTRCKELKLKNSIYFPLHNKTKDGLDSWCRVCRSEYRSKFRRGLYKEMISNEELQNLLKFKNCMICNKEVDKLVIYVSIGMVQ